MQFRNDCKNWKVIRANREVGMTISEMRESLECGQEKPDNSFAMGKRNKWN